MKSTRKLPSQSTVTNAGASASTAANSGIQRHIRNFIQSRRAASFTESTVKHYEKTFKVFGTFLDEQEPDVANVGDIDHHVCNRFVTHLQDQGKAARTIFGYQMDLKAWFNWLIADEQISRHPFGTGPLRKVKMVKCPKTNPDFFSIEEWQAMERATSGKSPRDIRNRALIYYLLDTALRLDSAFNVTIGQCDLTNGVISDVMTKGQKEKQAFLSPKTVQALRVYLRLHPDAQDASAPLWITTRGDMTYWGLQTIITKLGRKATYVTADGVKKSVKASPHKFRRTAALNALKSGMSIYEVQQMLGHQDIQVLKHYIQFLDADIQAAHKQRGPMQFFDRKKSA